MGAQGLIRFLFLLILAGGAASAFVYPWAVQGFTGVELGEWQVYDTGTGFRPIDVQLDDTDAPVRVLVDMTSIGAPSASGSRTILTLTAAIAGRTVLAQTLTFVNAVARDDTPQTQEQIYREDVGLLDRIDDGTYRFTLGPGDAEGIQMKSVRLVLRGRAESYDPRAQPVGFTLMAIGAIGFILGFRGRSNPRNPNSPPPGPRWGRDGSNS